jgi:hypothetical protein
MSKTRRNTSKGGGADRHISVRAVRRNPPDLRKLSRALIQLAIAQAAAEAEAQAENPKPAKWDPAPEASDE